MSEVAEIRAAISALEAQRETLGDAVVAAATQALRDRLEALEREPATPGEWKQVTILFADISGFTALSVIANAEEVRSTINACFDRLGEAVARYGGYIDKFIGDEMMVLFGAPRAMEDHASSALYASLEMRDALNRFNHENSQLRQRPLSVHFGLNSGLIVAGEMGTEARRDYTVMGDAVNVASRLVSRASAGEILVGASTRHLGGHDFEFEDLGSIELDGHAPVEAQRLVRPKYHVPHRGGASLKTRMLGREPEIRALQAAFGLVTTRRESRSVAVFGPAGIGKSRLQVEFLSWLHEKYPSAPVLYGAAIAHMSATPYFIVADFLRSWLGVNQADSSRDIRTRLEASLGLLGINEEETLHALAAVMAIEYDDDQLRNLLPEERRRRIFSSLRAFCEGVAARGPAAMVLEDVHWADDLSLDLLEWLSRELTAPFLFVALSRPVIDPAAEAREIETRLTRAGYVPIHLKELDLAVSSELIAALAPGLERFPDVVEAIVGKSEGNPFFMEEIIASLLDQGVLAQSPEGIKPQRPDAPLAVPETVWDVLAERIDTLPAAERRVIQSAAVVGRLFWEGLAGELSGCEAAGPLDVLRQHQFVDLQGPASFADDWEWLFRHVLVQDVAYSSLLYETRKTTHLRVAEWLEARLGDRLGEYVTLLAHHFAQGEEWERAARFAELAGDRASDLFAYADARVWYLKALEGLGHQGDESDIRRRQIDVTLKLAGASFYTPTDEIHRALESAENLARSIEDRGSQIKLMAAIASWQFMAGRGAAAVQTATRTIEEATAVGLEQLLSVPYSVLGKALILLGDFGKAAPILEKSKVLAETSGNDALARYHLVPTLGYLGMNYEAFGQMEKAHSLQAACLKMAEQRNDLRQIAAAHIYYGCYACIQGNLSKAFGHLETAVAMLEDRGDPVALYCALGFLGYCYAQRNDLERARSHIDRALGLAGQVGSTVFVPMFQAYRADVDIRAGNLNDAIELAGRAVALGREVLQRQSEAEAHRVLGWALFYGHPGNTIEAEQELRAAADLERACASPVVLGRTLFELADYLKCVGNLGGAEEARSEAAEIVRESGSNWLPVPAVAPTVESSDMRR